VKGRRHHYPRRVLLLIVAAAILTFPAATASATTDFTWTGTATSPDWSNGANWGGTAPSGAVGTLNFQQLTSSACTQTVPSDTCYGGTDDIGGLTANELAIDPTVGFDLTGDQPLTLLGPEGLDVSGDQYPAEPSSIAVPIELGGSQAWTIAGSVGFTDIALQGGIDGSTHALQVGISSEANLHLGGDSEVGAVTFTGSESYEAGFDAEENGTISLDSDSVSVNSDDGHPVELVDAVLAGPGATGPLTSTGGAIAVNSGILHVDGSVSLDNQSALVVGANSAGTTPGTSYAQLSATGNNNLGGAALRIYGACAGLVPGQALTIVTTTGTLSGTFSGTPDGTIVTGTCGAPAPTFEIHYTAGSVTATVVTPGPSETSTVVSVDPSSAETEHDVTLTATVTAGSGTPWGTVTFASTPSWAQTLDYGVPCGSNIPLQAVSGVSTMTTASCTIPFPAAGSPYTIEASYTPGPPPQEPGTDATTVPSTGTTSLSVAKAATSTVLLEAFGSAGTYDAYVSPGVNTQDVPVSGTVAFFNDGSPVADCAAVAISDDLDGGSAACPGIDPTGADVTASYSGDANYLGSSSLEPASAAPAPTPAPPSAPVLSPTLLLGRPHASTRAVSVEVTCTLSGAVACGSIEAVLTVRETTDAGKIIAVTASSKRRSRTRTRTVQLGRATAVLTATVATHITVELNSAGRQLLAKPHDFRADLAVESIGNWPATTATTTVTVTAAKKSKHDVERT